MKVIRLMVMVAAVMLLFSVVAHADEAVDTYVQFTNSTLSVTNSGAAQYLLGLRMTGAFDGANECSFTLSTPGTVIPALLQKTLTTTNTLTWSDEGALNTIWASQGVLTYLSSASAASTNSVVRTTLNKRPK